ncbi:hypothetical protein VRN11_000718 [Salmonella enterica]|nr:hypothetical protein [Salmonella enterica]
MKEGYYWIQHNGVAQVAYYTNDTVDDLESGQLIVGVWHLTRGDDICHTGPDGDIEHHTEITFQE